jgi:Nuclear pore complex assembly
MTLISLQDDMPDTPPVMGEWINLFELSPEKFAWRDPIPQEIEARRAQMSDKLIFDVLLASAGIQQPDTLFPPADVASLRRLLDAIQSSGYDTLKKDCVVYWLLKWHQDGRSKKFREARGIPPQFVTLADAFWLLDTSINVEVRSHI